MFEGRCRDEWAHTSIVLAMLANVNRDPKKTRPFKPEDFNPYMHRPVRLSRKAGFKMLKSMFVKDNKKKEGKR